MAFSFAERDERNEGAGVAGMGGYQGTAASRTRQRRAGVPCRLEVGAGVGWPSAGLAGQRDEDAGQRELLVAAEISHRLNA